MFRSIRGVGSILYSLLLQIHFAYLPQILIRGQKAFHMNVKTREGDEWGGGRGGGGAQEGAVGLLGDRRCAIVYSD